MRLLAISGSLRRDSYNTQLLRAAEELGPSDLDVDLYEGLAEIPRMTRTRRRSGLPGRLRI